jgi:hypothetical protein
MSLRQLQLERFDVRAVFAVAAPLIAALAGCAAGPAPRPDPSTGASPFVGVFTGDFVDGKPFYRFPTIEVVGSRRSIAPGQ